MKAVLRHHEKLHFQNRYVLEMTIYEVHNKSQYPKGIKYRLICVDLKSGKKVLMDNHHPKQDHVHLDDLEFNYEFKSIDELVRDFKTLVKQHLGVNL